MKSKNKKEQNYKKVSCPKCSCEIIKKEGLRKMRDKTEKELLQEINNKLELLILITSLNGKTKEERKKILKNYRGSISKRELERITGIDRHEF